MLLISDHGAGFEGAGLDGDLGPGAAVAAAAPGSTAPTSSWLTVPTILTGGWGMEAAERVQQQ
jgi:hypothetical protein